ncbi:MAG: hypothetical protein PWQ79_1034 [Thermococcaceae archaeon]|nr:hypothetical protein [Thermococcaceae archaeon]MDK2914119.1 hypothetical protein [Thermococcaceae archaeon]
MELVARKELLELLIKEARREKTEICGFLLGKTVGEKLIVEDLRFVSNRLQSPHEFEMEPLEMVEALEEAEGRGLEIVGIFHSHLKCPPKPSPRDLEGMRLWPIVWVIVTPEGEARAWILKENCAEQVKITLLKTREEEG